MNADPNSLVTDSVPRVAIDNQGNAVVVFVHGSTIQANRYTAATDSWGTPVPVDARTGGANPPDLPSIAVTRPASGPVQWLAVWRQDFLTAGLRGIWQSTSPDGVNWSGPVAITTAMNADQPVLDMNHDGVAGVGWVETNSSTFNITMMGSVRTTLTGAWSAPRALRQLGDQFTDNPAIAVSGRGDIHVTWEQLDTSGATSYDSIWYIRYDATNGWGTEAQIDNAPMTITYSAGVAANQAGRAILTWQEPTPATQQFWVRRYDPTTGVLGAAELAAEAADITFFPTPAATLDDAGVATLAFSAATSLATSAHDNVTVVRAAWGQPWQTAVQLETDNYAFNSDALAFRATYPSLGSDSAGNVIVTWRKEVMKTGGMTRYDMWTRRFSAGAWEPAVLLGSQDPNDVIAPVVAVAPTGVAVAVWYYANSLQPWAAVYR